MSQVDKAREQLLQADQMRKDAERMIYESMAKGDPNTLTKAHQLWQTYLANQNAALGGTDKKSLLLDPNDRAAQMEYKSKRTNMSYTTLRRMGRTPLIGAIIMTRADQVSEFSVPQESEYTAGFYIEKKGSFTDKTKKQLTTAERKRIDELTEFVLECGTHDDSTRWGADSFETFLRKFVHDSLTLDQGVFEIVNDRVRRPVQFFAVDGATFRVVDPSVGDRGRQQMRKKERGYYPTHVQIYEDQIVSEFYPWELCFGVRNPQTNLINYGYGTSELEILIRVVTWMLYGDQYNGNFFSQGSAPKGFMKVSGHVNNGRLAEFRQQWQSMTAGVENSWKTPLIEAENFEWIDMQKNNRDMEFGKWQEYLLKTACAIYKIDPSEVGFHLSGGANGAPVFESNNANRIKYSRDKGLRPLLRFIERKINRHIIEPLDPQYRFRFAGLDADSEKERVELDGKLVQSYMGVNEMRKMRNLPELGEDDVILNPVWMQNRQAAMMGGQESNEAIDNFTGDYEDDNPLYKALMNELEDGKFN